MHCDNRLEEAATMDRDKKGRRIYSLREFMKGVPIRVAGALVLSVVSDRLLSTVLTRRRKNSEFAKDSIFTPAKNKKNKI